MLLETIQEICEDTVEINFADYDNGDHYRITPYSFHPKLGKKLTTNHYTDLGQGLLEVIGEIHKNMERV